MSTPNLPNTQQATAVTSAAQKYNVPQSVLWGVWGMETDFGANVKTSSAGAVGNFQFLPSTARQYGYPLTNSPTQPQLQQQADAAAHYLSDLFKRTGSWDAALKAYSGGGYGLAQVQNKSQNLFTPSQTPNVTNIPGVGPVVSAAQGAAQGVSDVGNAISSVWSSITTPALWKRVLYFVGGAVLLFLGIKELTGAHVPQSVKTAAVAAA